jgi:hypothetical protein
VDWPQFTERPASGRLPGVDAITLIAAGRPGPQGVHQGAPLTGGNASGDELVTGDGRLQILMIPQRWWNVTLAIRESEETNGERRSVEGILAWHIFLSH